MYSLICAATIERLLLHTNINIKQQIIINKSVNKIYHIVSL